MEINKTEITFKCSYGKETLNQLQEVLFDMYGEVSDIFDKNGIRYFLIYGSLLGAMRHGGFIPWDDDFDIAVMSDDYDKAMQVLEKNVSSKYTMQTRTTDENYICDWTKLRYTNSMVFHTLFPIENTFKIQGIALDIYRCWPDRISKYTKKSRIHKSAFKHHVSNILFKNGRKKIPRSIAAGCYHLVMGSFYCFIDNFLSKKDVYAIDPLFYPPIDKDWLFPLQTVVFNGKKCPVPANSNGVLIRYYGNWHELPAEEKRHTHYGQVTIGEGKDGESGPYKTIH
jgi:lipopolysaccharide cholinephosphotransferase